MRRLRRLLIVGAMLAAGAAVAGCATGPQPLPSTHPTQRQLDRYCWTVGTNQGRTGLDGYLYAQCLKYAGGGT